MKIDNIFSILVIILFLFLICDQCFSVSDYDISYINNNHKYDDLFKKYSKEFNIEWIDIKIQSFIESSLRNNKTSYVGAIGLMQIMLDTFEEISNKIYVTDIKKPEDNIRAGVYYMNWLKEYINNRYNSNDIRLSLIAYNYGIGNLNKIINHCGSLDINEIKNYIPDETKDYLYKFSYIKEKIKLQSNKKTVNNNKDYITNQYNLICLSNIDLYYRRNFYEFS